MTSRALEDAGLTIDDIDSTVTVCNDFWDGRTISCMTITEATGSHKVPTTNVEGDGTYGALMGLMHLLSGIHDSAGRSTEQSLGGDTIGNHQRPV